MSKFNRLPAELNMGDAMLPLDFSVHMPGLYNLHVTAAATEELGIRPPASHILEGGWQVISSPTARDQVDIFVTSANEQRWGNNRVFYEDPSADGLDQLAPPVPPPFLMPVQYRRGVGISLSPGLTLSRAQLELEVMSVQLTHKIKHAPQPAEVRSTARNSLKERAPELVAEVLAEDITQRVGPALVWRANQTAQKGKLLTPTLFATAGATLAELAAILGEPEQATSAPRIAVGGLFTGGAAMLGFMRWHHQNKSFREEAAARAMSRAVRIGQSIHALYSQN